jgi:hypothetical protein
LWQNIKETCEESANAPGWKIKERMAEYVKVWYQKNKHQRVKQLPRPGQKHDKVYMKAYCERNKVKIAAQSRKKYLLAKEKKLRDLVIDNQAESKEVELQPRHEQHFDSSALYKKEETQEECKSEVKQEEC